MIRYLIILAFVFGALPLFGHTPSTVSLSYRKDSQLLTVSIIHPVNNTDRHHIKTIVIHVNGKETIRHELTAQDSTEGHEGIYKILLKSGDKVRASAFCSIQGSNNTEITID